MSNSNPLQGYAFGLNPPVTNNSIIVNGVYAVNGVIDTIGSNVNRLPDPSSNQFTVASPLVLPNNKVRTVWTSDIVEDSEHNEYTLNFRFSTTTYINQVRFDLLNVPCTWNLYRSDSTGVLTQLSVGAVINYDTSSYQHLSITLEDTLLFNTNYSLVLVLTKTVTGTQYQFSVKNFLTKLIVKNKDDITVNGVTISGVTTQNTLGFIETFSPVEYKASNILTSDITDYWKCSPQPTGDSIVYLTVDLGSLQTINRLFLDPLYSDTVFNLYWSYDGEIWTPVQRDFRLRRGLYELPTVSTRYLKFEFTQLTAEPYQLPFNQIERKIEVFPDWVDSFYTNLEKAIPNIANNTYSQSSAVTPNTSYNTQLATTTLYGSAVENLTDTSYGARPSAAQTSRSVLNTTSITDPTVSYKTLLQTGDGTVYNPLTDVNFFTRRFPMTGKHVYKQLTIQQSWHQAYFTGLKQLKIYGSTYTEQTDYPEITDYLLSSGSGSMVSTLSNGMTFRAPSIVSTSGITTVSGGGYTGPANAQLTTRTLNTVTKYDSFKFAMLSSEWETLLSNEQTVLLGTTLTDSPLNITTSSGLTGTQISSSSSKYNIWEITPSGKTSFLQSESVGGHNLLTLAEANFTSGGWVGTNPYTNATISGLTLVSLTATNSRQSSPAYGQNTQGYNSLGSPPSLGNSVSAPYTFTVTVTGTGDFSVIPSVTYSGTAVVNGSYVASGVTYTTTVTGTASGTAAFTSLAPPWASQVKFILVNSGVVTYSKAGFMPGSGTEWTSPLVTRGMRMSAMSRIYLPSTNAGSYRCSLYSGDTELAHNSYSNLPTKTWLDLQVAFTLTSGYYDYSQFNVRLTQNSTIPGEKYRIALLGLFYNPVAVEYTSDGTNWNWIATGINDPHTSINLVNPSNQLQLRATLVQDQADISAISIIPNYPQNPFYSTTEIQYLGDPKTNELSWRRSPAQRPLFQLGTETYPAEYDQTILMNIRYPFKLG